MLEGVPSPLSGENGRLFEDSYGIVAVLVYETWDELATSWQNAQGALVELLSNTVPNAEPKAWEGYLALLTPGTPPPRAATKPHEIRLDIVRLRKFVAVGEELASLGGVRAALLPLLSLESTAGVDSGESVLELLPSMFASRGIDEEATRQLVDSFRRNEPLLESLHAHLQRK